jgi:hypothetical protein
MLEVGNGALIGRLACGSSIRVLFYGTKIKRENLWLVYLPQAMHAMMRLLHAMHLFLKVHRGTFVL